MMESRKVERRPLGCPIFDWVNLRQEIFYWESVDNHMWSAIYYTRVKNWTDDPCLRFGGLGLDHDGESVEQENQSKTR
jgi:hypothetical protein